MNTIAVLIIPMLASWASVGCDVSTVIPEDSESVPTSEEVIRVTNSWPEGWIVVHSEEWLPVLDELGQRLHSARAEFQLGDRQAAASEVGRGIAYLEARFAGSSERDRAALERAVGMLRAISARLSGEEEVTLVQLDIAFANAYLADLEREALVVEEGSTAPYLDRPGAHLERSVELFLSNDTVEAAREIDRASAYLYLEANRLGLSERSELNESAQNLEYLSARLRLGGIRDRAELDRVFEPAIQRWRLHASAPDRFRSLGLMR